MNSIINKEDIDDSIYYDRYLQIKKQYINAKENVQTSGGVFDTYFILQLNEEQYNKLLMFYSVEIKMCTYDIINFKNDNKITIYYEKDYNDILKGSRIQYFVDDDFKEIDRGNGNKELNIQHISSVLNALNSDTTYFIIGTKKLGYIFTIVLTCVLTDGKYETVIMKPNMMNTLIDILKNLKINTNTNYIVKYIDNIKTEKCFNNLKRLLEGTSYKGISSLSLPVANKEKYIMGLCAFLKALVLDEQNILDIILNKCTEYGISSFVNKYYESNKLIADDDKEYNKDRLIYSIVKIISSEYNNVSPLVNSALEYYKAISGKISWLDNNIPDKKPENVLKLLYVIMLCDSKYINKNKEHTKYNPPLLCAYRLLCDDQVYSKFLYELILIYNKADIGIVTSNSYISVLKQFINKIYDLFTYLNNIKTEPKTEPKPIEHIRVKGIIENYGNLIIDSQQPQSIKSYDIRFYQDIPILMSNVSEIIMKYIDDIVLYKSKGIEVVL